MVKNNETQSTLFLPKQMMRAECSPIAAKGISDFVSGLLLGGLGGDKNLTYNTSQLTSHSEPLSVACSVGPHPLSQILGICVLLSMLLNF